MIDMRVTEHHQVDVLGLEPELTVGVHVGIPYRFPLEHPTIEE